MRSLYESLLDDFDAIADRQDVYSVITEFADKLKEDNKWCADRITVNTTTEEVVVGDRANIYVNIDIPQHIKFSAPNATVIVAKNVEDMASLKDVFSLTFCGDDVKVDNMRPINSKEIRIETGFFKEFDWLPKELDEFTIAPGFKYPNIDIPVIDLLNRKIKAVYIKGCHKTTTLKNIYCGYLEIDNCDKLTTVENCEIIPGTTSHWDSVNIGDCKNLKEFKGKNSFADIKVDATIKKFDPTTLPQNLERIHGARNLGQEWLWDNISTSLPNLKFEKCQLPDVSKFKALHNPDYKKGAWVVVRGKHKSSGPMGNTRGDLCVDRIKNINKSTGGITTENNGAKAALDFELMRDANEKKDWSYVDPNGINDITGVGIEVGDEVVVYCASGSFGKNNGIEVDVVTTIHKNRVGCKLNLLRRPQDICILRSQKLCDEQFK